MLARLRRFRHPWWLMLVLIICALLAIEATRFITTQLAVDRAAREAARYAVTGVYDQKYCASPYNLPCTSSDQAVREEAEDQARLYTIKDVALAATAGILVNSTSNLNSEANASGVTVCSSRQGFAYDSVTGQCIPREDAGGPGDKVLVDVGTDYRVGALLGNGLGPIRLHSSQELIVERYRTVRIQGLPPVMDESGTTNGRFFTRISTTPVQEPVTIQPGREQMIVMNGDLQLQVDQVDQSLAQVKTIAADAGGYVAKAEAWSEGAVRSARAELRIPAAQFQATMDKLKGLALQVRRESSVGEDVTEEYVDLEGRLQGLQATATRTQALLDKAQTVDESLHVNTELGRLQEQIEQITGRMEYLKNRVAYSTITVALNPVTAPPATEAWLPGTTLERAINFLGSVARFLGDVLIWIVVVGVPLALLIWIVRRTLQRMRVQKK